VSGIPRKHTRSLQRRPSLAFSFGHIPGACVAPSTGKAVIASPSRPLCGLVSELCFRKRPSFLASRRFAQENPTPYINDLIELADRTPDVVLLACSFHKSSYSCIQLILLGISHRISCYFLELIDQENNFSQRASRTTWDPANDTKRASGQAAFWLA
jgi:hypothetical protein